MLRTLSVEKPGALPERLMRPDLIVAREAAGDSLGEVHCRQIADKTPHHSPTRLTTAEHRGRPEPRTVQHVCTLGTTTRHGFRMFPKPGVAGSIPAGGTTSFLQIGTFPFRLCGHFLPNRQNCRHFADENGQHGSVRENTGQHGRRVRAVREATGSGAADERRAVERCGDVVKATYSTVRVGDWSQGLGGPCVRA